MKILLADDHDLVRDTIAAYLTSGGDMGEKYAPHDFMTAAYDAI